ncbi:MAG: Anaphase-promoting complex subunit 23 [Vezdaea aestivalis]|nr:MAG: Anaphase-promoting complex subunit 23 [Vezdaea aestivalis]
MANLAQKRGQLRALLQEAVVKCSERCLYQSAKWTAELLISVPLTDGGSDPLTSDPTAAILTASRDPEEAELEAKEAHKYLLAKSYFDCKEFDRCCAVFLPSDLPTGSLSGPPASPKTPKASLAPSQKSKGKQSAEPPRKGRTKLLPRLSQKSLFLALYAKFIAGEKRKDEDSEMVLGPADGTTVNKDIGYIASTLESWFADRKDNEQSQGWLEYLYGIVLAKGKNDKMAREYLIRSVNIYPFNWGAWQELSDLLKSVEELNQVLSLLSQNIMMIIFFLYASQELYQCNDSVYRALNDLENYFPRNQFLETQKALLFYHAKDFEQAESTFSLLVQKDPHRIDYMDNYSNILYVMNQRPKLAFLAQLATATDKFRPETCCVVGNYYSLKSEHEKAVMYFRRALTLDRSFLSAWTLMGHEYVEMKNTHAAIESYRRAVDVNRKDYRAWYGLGQTYEVLEMHYYALFYYQRAASLTPYDPKMWQAIGSCFNKMERPRDAIKAHKRALIAGSFYDRSGSSFGSAGADGPPVPGSMDPDTLYQIALMYEKMGDTNEAVAYMEMTVAQEDGGAGSDDESVRIGGVGVTPTTCRARMWMARFEAARGELKLAFQLATGLCEDGVEVDIEEAKALVRELRARLEETPA